MLKLAPETEQAQAAADRHIEQALDALRAIGMSPSAMAPAALAPVLEAVRADEREACIAALEKVDRDGLEWVRGSLWETIWRRSVNALRARRPAPADEPLPALKMHGPLDRYLKRRRADGKGPDE